jgi:cbb3-type cytochrome oxidase cytochrome c subunit
MSERRYVVTYTDHDAVYPAERKTATVIADSKTVWNKAVALGFVRTIYDLDSVATVVSINWDFNHLGLPQSVLDNYWTAC